MEIMTHAKDPALIARTIELRHSLHHHPELSGHEGWTAALIARRLSDTGPDRLLTGLGGHGVAAEYRGQRPGPTVMLRAELDGLPIQELSALAYKSGIPGHGHLCGHDGHMAILAGMAQVLARARPASGRVILLFQPAEEDGTGAAKVIADPQFAEISPDYAFAFHNMPGIALGHAAIAAGPANCASCGMLLRLQGRTAHASQPETGLSPAPALAALISAFGGLSRGTGPTDADFRLVTITHAQMGAPAFGIAPADAELWLTLRTQRDDQMADMREKAEALVQAHAGDLAVQIEYRDEFAACTNDAKAAALFAAALTQQGLTHDASGLPMRASEDFGRFATTGARTAMALLGAGEIPALHNPDYDFPDALIDPGIRVFDQLLRNLLG